MISDEELRFIDYWNCQSYHAALPQPDDIVTLEVAGMTINSDVFPHYVEVVGSWKLSYSHTIPYKEGDVETFELVSFEGSIEAFRRDIILMKLVVDDLDGHFG